MGLRYVSTKAVQIAGLVISIVSLALSLTAFAIIAVRLIG